jgi:hypothetical protein
MIPLSYNLSSILILCLNNPWLFLCILLGISPASDCGLPTFRNHLSVPSSRAGYKVWIRRRGNTQKNTYKIQNTAKVWNQESVAYFLPYFRFSFQDSARRTYPCFLCMLHASAVVFTSVIIVKGGHYVLPVQTGPGAHPASCKMGTESFPGVKRDRGVLLTTHLLLVPRSRKSRAIPLPTLWAKPGL